MAEPPRHEVCICAAVQTLSGRVFRGHRHVHCFRAAEDAGESLKNHMQGFITSTGRFVHRLDGRELQEAAGIDSVHPDGYRGDLLFSEDLY